jgi:hypothetical protein
MPTRREAIAAAAKAAIGTACCGLMATRADAAPAAGARPGQRAGHALAYHAGLAAMCLIGGDDDGPDRPREEPWLWNGREWTMRRTGDGPGVASLVVAASDPERKSVLIFGGFSVLGRQRYGPPMGELWELTAEGAWRRPPVEGLQPGPRHHHAGAFDSARGRFVIYGGIDSADTWVRDVWEWDRSGWHRIHAERPWRACASCDVLRQQARSHRPSRRHESIEGASDRHMGMGRARMAPGRN